MKQIIIIHGGDCFDNKELFYKALRERDYNPFEKRKKRRNRIAEQTLETHQTILPEMPNKNNADYTAWKIWFERQLPFLSNDETILIGYSLGGIFLAKRLSENTFPKDIKQLHLVAACFDDEGMEDEGIGNFGFTPNNLKNILPQTKEIFLYHSKDDDIVPFENCKKFIQYLPTAEVTIFEDRGHFPQETFPELLENIVSSHL